MAGQLNNQSPPLPSPPKLIVVWNDGKSSTIVNQPEHCEQQKPEKDEHFKPLPFQYQIPVNKYSTLHSISVKRVATRWRQKTPTTARIHTIPR